MATYKKQLRDKDNNIIYPAQGLGTIIGDNIDFTQFEAFDIAVSGSNALSVNKPYPFKIFVMGSVSTWGYGGGIVTTSISTSAGSPTEITRMNGKGSGGDTVGRNVDCSCLYSCSANTNYGFQVTIASGGGQTTAAWLVGFIVRTGN